MESPTGVTPSERGELSVRRGIEVGWREVKSADRWDGRIKITRVGDIKVRGSHATEVFSWADDVGLGEWGADGELAGVCMCPDRLLYISDVHDIR